MKLSRLPRAALVCAGMLAASATAAPAAEVTVTVTNATHAIYFTPLLVTGHGAAEALFELGQPASAALQAMAEGGDVAPLVSALGGADPDTVVDPAAGLLGPGQSATAVLDTDASGATHLSLVAMLLPTNDGFVGLEGWELPAAPGTWRLTLDGYDAGTEGNDELLNTVDGGVPGTSGIPADPTMLAGSGGTGVAATDAVGVVHVHRGNLGDTDPAGGPSDLDATAHRWLNPVAHVVITVQ